MKNFANVKRHFRRGASLMIALVIFLLCALAGITVFVMAATNAGRYSHSEEQEFHKVSSAALLVVDMLADLTYESKEITYDCVRNWQFSPGSDPENPSNQHSMTTEYSLAVPQLDADTAAGAGTMSGGDAAFTGSTLSLCDRIRAQCDRLVPLLNVPEDWYSRVKDDPAAPKKPEETEIPSVSYAFTVRLKDNDGFGTVNCNFRMNANYDLLFTFNGGNGEYSMTVY